MSDITNEKRLDHPKDFLAKGQIVKAVVLELDREKRRIRLGMKQLEPTSVDHYIAEHHAGETVSGRLVEIHDEGEGRARRRSDCAMQHHACRVTTRSEGRRGGLGRGALSAMLSARWKAGASEKAAGSGGPRAGQVCSFRISHIDPSKRLIQLELAS